MDLRGSADTVTQGTASCKISPIERINWLPCFVVVGFAQYSMSLVDIQLRAFKRCISELVPCS